MNQIFLYKGNQVTFANKGEVMVNATEMAKPFGKPPYEWLRLPSTEVFLNAVEATGKSRRSDMIQAVNGVGTWFHKDVAIEFARWLAPAFGIWCNDRILELLQTGSTSLRPKDSSILGALELTVQALREQNEKLEALEQWKEEVNQERAERLQELQQLPISQEAPPEQPITSKCRQIVNRISVVKNVPYKNIWDRVYSDLYYRYGISIKSYKKHGNESHLQVAERVGCVDKVLTIVSEMARQYKVEGAA